MDNVCSNCGKEFMVDKLIIVGGHSNTWFGCAGSEVNCCSLPCLIEFIAKEKVEKILKDRGLGG